MILSIVLLSLRSALKSDKLAISFLTCCRYSTLLINAPSVQLKVVEGGQHFLSASHPKVSRSAAPEVMVADVHEHLRITRKQMR